MTVWYSATSFQKPAGFDTTSSDFVVYQRRNIQKFEEFGTVQYIFEERTLTKAEYAELRAAELEEELTQTQLAMVEMYESLVIDNG